MKRILKRLLCVSLGLLNPSAMTKPSRNMIVGNSKFLTLRSNKRRLHNKSLMKKHNEENIPKGNNVKNDELFVSNHGGVAHFKKLKNGKFEITCSDGAKVVVTLASFLVIIGIVSYFFMPVNPEQALKNFNTLPSRKNAYSYLNALKEVVVKKKKEALTKENKRIKYVFSPGDVLDEIFEKYNNQTSAIEFIKKLARAILSDSEFNIDKSTLRKKIFPNLGGSIVNEDLKQLYSHNTNSRGLNDYVQSRTKEYLGKKISEMFPVGDKVLNSDKNKNAIAAIENDFMVTDTDVVCTAIEDNLWAKLCSIFYSGKFIEKKFARVLEMAKFEKDEIYGPSFAFDFVKNFPDRDNQSLRLCDSAKGSWKNFFYTVTLALMYVDKW